MRIRVQFLRDGDWWVAWTEQIPGAITGGPTLDEARGRLLDEVHRRGHAAAPANSTRQQVLVEELEV